MCQNKWPAMMVSGVCNSDTFTISNNTHLALQHFWNKIKSTFSLAVTPIAGKIF